MIHAPKHEIQPLHFGQEFIYKTFTETIAEEIIIMTEIVPEPRNY